MVNYSRIIGEVMVLMEKPSVSESPLRQGTRTCPRWDLAEAEVCGGGKAIAMISCFFWNLWEYIGERPRAKGVQGAHKPGWRGLPLAAWWGLVGPLGLPCLGSQASRSSSIPKIIFSGFFFRLDSVSKSPVKGVKTWKNRNWHLALS